MAAVPPRRAGLVQLACALLGSTTAAQAESSAVRSPASDAPRDGVLRAQLSLREADGARVALVFLDLRGGSGSESGDRELRRAIEGAAALSAGDVLRAADLRALPAQLDGLAGVRDARVSTFAASEPGSVVAVISATLEPPGAVGADARPAPAFPVLHQSDRSILRLQAAGAVGAFADHNPWFGAPAAFVGRSPIALDPPGAGWTSWAETYVEYGLAGAFRLGEAQATAFGEATALASSSSGSDLFRSDTRTRHAIEKAYAGVAWRDGERSLKLSSGRQNWQLYNGFLFSRFAAGSNAGPSPGLYQSPRTTYQRATLLDARWGRFRAEGFDVDPTEVEAFDSGTRYLGFNLRIADADAWEAGFTRYQVPESRARVALASGGTVPRQGMRTQALRLGWRNAAGLEGIDLVGEYASQDHRDVDWDAQAWYAQVAWRLDDLPWKPNLTYRRAVFSGDDPATPAQEAFDAQLSSGLDDWVQGVSFKKVVSNSNLATHRLRLNAGPRPTRNWTLDLFRLEADQPTASGARHYGDEVNLTLRWAVSPRVFVLGVAGVAWPGEVIDERTGGTARPWATVQASVFWGF
jgi:hypothetical protein